MTADNAGSAKPRGLVAEQAKQREMHEGDLWCRTWHPSAAWDRLHRCEAVLPWVLLRVEQLGAVFG
jgi:hypothetical protein